MIRKILNIFILLLIVILPNLYAESSGDEEVITFPKMIVPDPRKLLPVEIVFTGRFLNEKTGSPISHIDLELYTGNQLVASGRTRKDGEYEVIIPIRKFSINTYKSLISGNLRFSLSILGEEIAKFNWKGKLPNPKTEIIKRVNKQSGRLDQFRPFFLNSIFLTGIVSNSFANPVFFESLSKNTKQAFFQSNQLIAEINNNSDDERKIYDLGDSKVAENELKIFLKVKLSNEEVRGVFYLKRAAYDTFLFGLGKINRRDLYIDEKRFLSSPIKELDPILLFHYDPNSNKNDYSVGSQWAPTKRVKGIPNIDVEYSFWSPWYTNIEFSKSNALRFSEESKDFIQTGSKEVSFLLDLAKDGLIKEYNNSDNCFKELQKGDVLQIGDSRLSIAFTFPGVSYCKETYSLKLREDSSKNFIIGYYKNPQQDDQILKISSFNDPYRDLRTTLSNVNDYLKRTKLKRSLDNFQSFLDGLGFVEAYGLGVAADVFNTVVYVFRGNPSEAFISLISIIPFTDYIAKGGKHLYLFSKSHLSILFKMLDRGEDFNAFKIFVETNKGTGRSVSKLREDFANLKAVYNKVAQSGAGFVNGQKFVKKFDDVFQANKGFFEKLGLDKIDLTNNQQKIIQEIFEFKNSSNKLTPLIQDGFEEIIKKPETAKRLSTIFNKIDTNPNIFNGKKAKEQFIKSLRKANKVDNGIKFNDLGFPIFEGKGIFFEEVVIKGNLKTMTRPEHFKLANQALAEKITKNPNLKEMFTQDELRLIYKNPPHGGPPSERLTWHHHQSTGKMQLVKKSIHENIDHRGGHSIWGSGN